MFRKTPQIQTDNGALRTAREARAHSYTAAASTSAFLSTSLCISSL
jgi:hypothetical protein